MNNLKIVGLAALLFLAGCTQIRYGISGSEKQYAETFADNQNVKWGIPFGSDRNEEMLYERDEYVFDYNPGKGASNWVSYCLSISDFGKTPRRKGRFLTDPLLPDSLGISHNHYTHSGFDRGHMVRSLERTQSADSNKATFFMTNVFPQTPDLNRGVWLAFERFCNKLADTGYVLFINTGGIYGSDQSLKDEGAVRIPDSCYKTVLVMDTAGNIDLYPSDAFTIAVVMPNIAGIRGDDWGKYITTVRAVEKSTKLNFYPLLKRKNAEVLETVEFELKEKG